MKMDTKTSFEEFCQIIKEYATDEDYGLTIVGLIDAPKGTDPYLISFKAKTIELLADDCGRIFKLLQTADRVDVSPTEAGEIVVDVMYAHKR